VQLTALCQEPKKKRPPVHEPAAERKEQTVDTITQDGNGCSCSEGKRPEGTPNFDRPRHSCAYVAKRNSLISAAAVFADSLVPAAQRGRKEWSRIFSRRMEKLMRESQNGEGKEIVNAEMSN
jgi:hypothetical protein